jgi:hypothetical protein
MDVLKQEDLKQEDLRKFVNNEVYCCQTMVVEKLLEECIFDYSDIQNFYKSDKQLKEDGYKTKVEREEARRNGGDQNEIFEWWVVSDWLIKKLEAEEEPILKTDYGDWWGRTCTGQAIYLDYVIEKIYDSCK